MKVPNNCKNCNKEYIAETRELSRGNGMFCSRGCSGEFKSKNTKPQEPNVNCAICNKPFYVKKYRLDRNTTGIFYCSTEHQSEGARIKLHKTGPNPKSTEEITSQYKLCNLSEKYNCNRKTKSITGTCRTCYKQDRIERWLNGDIEVTWSKSSREPKTFVKQYLLKTRGDKCESCGYDKKRPDGSSKIQMDHIDGDYTNNLITNLRLLCPNCHEDTPTFGSRNKNGGRRYRLLKLTE